ncbi:MAG TPA: hypothetical protein VM537_17190 [Anaerolineae bacterium]|nr:hypothetical protein [Anaerolineae bacterium]
MDKNQYTEIAAKFLSEVERELYMVGAGRKEQLQLAAIFERYPDLFSREVTQVRLHERSSDSESTVARYLAAFAADGYMENVVKTLSEEITNEELGATVEWDGEELPFRQVDSVLGQEPDPTRRHELYQRQMAVTGRLHGRRIERLGRLHQEATSLGFPGYAELYDDLKGLQLSSLSEAMSRLLSATESAYTERLEDTLATAHVDPGTADVSDIAYCFRAAEFDRYFPGNRMVPSLQRTMAGMRLLKGDDFGFTLDIEPRPKKSPRAFCSPVLVPQEVYLVIKPQGGSDDYDSFFHEAGHAMHFSRIAPEAPWALRCLGDTDITETYAFLFHYLVHNSRWLRDVLGLPLAAAEEFRRFVLFKKTWFLRRYGAKLHYEMTLHSGDPAETCEAYVPTLANALQVRIAGEKRLSDVDDGLYVAQYLRAWIFEAMLRRFLEAELGESWWTNPDAGWFLRDWWRRGQALPISELAREIGYEGLDAGPLVEELTEAW